MKTDEFNTSKQVPQERLQLIDAMRAFAISAVFINHLAPTVLPSGYLGVDIFFVISGFVITKVINERELSRGNLSDFYAKRFSRISPLYLSVIIAGVVLVGLFVDPRSINYWTNIATALTAVFGLSNIFLVLEQSNYFGTLSSYNLFTHMWSLCVELQFYFLFPLLFIIKKNSDWKKSYSLAKKLIALISALSLFAYFYLNLIRPFNSYYLMPTRFWEFGFGIGSYFLYCNKKYLKTYGNLIFRIGSIFMLIVLIVPEKYIFLSTIVIVIATSCCLACIKHLRNESAIYKNILIQKIGILSYSIYLWHGIMISVFRWTIGINLFSTLLVISLVAILSSLSHRLIEKPSKAFLNKRKAASVNMTWVIGTTCSFVFIFALGFLLRGNMFLGDRIHENWHTKSIFSSGCDLRGITESKINDCGTNLNVGNSTIYLVGDSHAKQYESPLKNFAISNNLGFSSFWGSGCVFPPISSTDSKCRIGGDFIQNIISNRVASGDLVVLSNHLLNYFSNEGKVGISKSLEQKDLYSSLDSEYFAYLKKFADVVTGKNARIVYITDSVQFPSLDVGALCNTEWFRPEIPESCFRSKSDFLKTYKSISDNLTSLQNEGLLKILDGMEWSSCNHDVCDARYMSDSNHFVDWYTWTIINDSKSFFNNLLYTS